MALTVRASINLQHTVLALVITRKEQHHRLKRAFWYDYEAKYIDEVNKPHLYSGRLLHGYDNGAVALIAKVTRAITKQQKEEVRNAN